jgi:hypothetical protein
MKASKLRPFNCHQGNSILLPLKYSTFKKG